MAERYQTTFNAGDADGLSNLFSEDGTYLTPVGAVLSDRQAIKNGIAARMKNGQPKVTQQTLEAHPVGDAVWSTGEWTLTPADGKEIAGHYAYVIVPSGKEWRLRMAISNITPPK